jgi:hypothetical protein
LNVCSGTSARALSASAGVFDCEISLDMAE